jgi:hypothetical protein
VSVKAGAGPLASPAAASRLGCERIAAIAQRWRNFKGEVRMDLFS